MALQHRIDADNGAALVRLMHDRGVRVELGTNAPLGFHVFADGAELNDEALESNEVTAIVSTIAKHAAVRAAMV